MEIIKIVRAGVEGILQNKYEISQPCYIIADMVLAIINNCWSYDANGNTITGGQQFALDHFNVIVRLDSCQPDLRTPESCPIVVDCREDDVLGQRSRLYLGQLCSEVSGFKLASNMLRSNERITFTSSVSRRQESS